MAATEAVEDPKHTRSGLSIKDRVVATIGGKAKPGRIVGWCAYTGSEPKRYTGHGDDATGACVMLDENLKTSTVPTEVPLADLAAE